MKYNGFYFWMFKSPMKKVLVEKYGREYAADIMKKSKKVYRELVEKADDIGDDNPMYVCSCDAAATNGTITRCQLHLMKPTSLFIMNLRRARQRRCDDDSIKSYFIDAGKNLTYTNLRRLISDSLEDKPFPPLSKELQKHTYFEFGSIEDHFKYRQAVMEAYSCGHYPVFEGYDHMQYQIRDPKGFAEMLAHIAERDCMPELPFIRK